MIISLERYEDGRWICAGSINVKYGIDQDFLRSMHRIGLRNLSSLLTSWARQRKNLEAFVCDAAGDIPHPVAEEIDRVYGKTMFEAGPVRLITFRFKPKPDVSDVPFAGF